MTAPCVLILIPMNHMNLSTASTGLDLVRTSDLSVPDNTGHCSKVASQPLITSLMACCSTEAALVVLICSSGSNGPWVVDHCTRECFVALHFRRSFWLWCNCSSIKLEQIYFVSFVCSSSHDSCNGPWVFDHSR